MALQALVYAWIYPRVFSTRRDAWLNSAFSFALVFGPLAWSFTTLPGAAKYRMTSIGSFMALESAFTFAQLLLVSLLIALDWRERS
jgi:hypothetical protein